MKKKAVRLLANSFLVLLTIVITGAAVEFFYRQATEVDESNNYFEWDCANNNKSLIGGFVPNCKGRWKVKEVSGAFDTSFSTDKFGRRIVFEKKNKSSSDTGQLFLFGGSEVLGKGVNDEETIANQVLQIADFVTVKNYGGPGFGVQHALELLQFSDLTKEAPPDPDRNIGILIYGDDHVNRAAGTWAIATAWGASFPYYELDSEDKLVFKGTFASGGRFSPVLLLAKKSLILDTIFAWIHGYFSFSDSNIRLTAKLILALKEEFLSKYKNARFYVVTSPITSKSTPRLQKLLKEFGVEILDQSKLWDPNSPASQIPEGHPSPAVYRTIAGQLASDLKNLK